MHTHHAHGAVMDKPIDMMDKSSVIAYIMSLIATFIGSLTVEEWYWAASVLIGLIAAATNIYFKARDDRRKQERHDLHMSTNRDE